MRRSMFVRALQVVVIALGRGRGGRLESPGLSPPGREVAHGRRCPRPGIRYYKGAGLTSGNGRYRAARLPVV
jgi:hypothetical protein